MDTTQRIQAKLDAIQVRSRLATKRIWVRFQREGIHAYPAAAELPELEDVSFLANEHRHIFHFEVGIEVEYNDRDIEFIQFKRFCEGLFTDDILQLNNQSCEMISDAMFEKIAYTYPNREVIITVSEDNENGSTTQYKDI